MYGALLVSKDEGFLRRAARYIPNINKYIEIITAGSSEDAADTLSGPDQIDVIIGDHAPPALDAVALYNDRCRQNDTRPFIIVSAKVDGGLAIRAFELRMDYYLSREDTSMHFYEDLAAKIVICAERRRSEIARELNERRLQALVALADMHSRPLADIMKFSLEASVSLTGSQFAYVALYDGSKRKLTLIAATPEKTAPLGADAEPPVFDLDRAGLWGEPVRTGQTTIVNDYQHDVVNQKKPLPVFREDLRRMLMVPIIHSGVVVATAGVGNKIREYTADDENQLRLLMDSVVSIYQERMLRAENEKADRDIQSVLNSAYAGLLVLDRNLCLSRYNPYAQEILGLASDELHGVPLERCRNDAARQVAAAASATLLDDKPRDTYVSGRVNNVLVQGYATVSPVLDEDRKTTGFLVVITDMTKLSQRGVSSDEVMERLGAVSGIVSSELRRISAEMRQRAADSGDLERLKSAVEIVAEAETLARFIDGYSRIGQHRPVWQRLEDDVQTIPAGLLTTVHVSGIRILADPSFNEVFRLLGEHSLKNKARCVLVGARIEGGQLTINYEDDGLGPAAAGNPSKGEVADEGIWSGMAKDLIVSSGFTLRTMSGVKSGSGLEIVVPSSSFALDFN